MGSFAQGALINQLTSTATTGGTVTLTASSTSWQRFTGTLVETVVLPDATTLKVGRSFIISNRTTQTLTIQYNGGTLAAYIASGTQREFYLLANGTTAGDWVVDNQIDIDAPLSLHQTRPTADATLNIASNQLVNTDGCTVSTSPADDVLVTYPGTYIQWQTSTATGGTGTGAVTLLGGTFARPSVTSGNYVRMALVYQSSVGTYGTVDTYFSAQQAVQANLANPATLFDSLSGVPIGYIDLQSTGTGTFNFKSAGAASNIITNSSIVKFGSGSGSGSSGDTSFKIQSVDTTNSTAKIKGGYEALETNKIIATWDGTTTAEANFGKDLTIALNTVAENSGPLTLVNGTPYYLYIDKTLITGPITVSDSNRQLYEVIQATFYLSATTFENIDVQRYFPIGTVLYGTGAWTTTATTYPSKRHNDTGFISDFKLQSITGTTLLIKAGYIELSDGREIYASADFTVSLASYSADGNYYCYVDLFSLPTSTVVSGRTVQVVAASNILLSTTVPSAMGTSRYLPLGKAVRSSGVWATPTTTALKQHNFPVATDSTLVFAQAATTVSTVGTSGQIMAGHVLAQLSFPTAAYSTTSFYKFSSTSTVNDGNTLANNLTNNGTVTFTSTGILGLTNACASLNGTSQYLNSIAALFDPAWTSSNFTTGGWFKPTSFTPAAVNTLFGQWVNTYKSFVVYITAAGALNVDATTNNGTTVQNVISVSPLSSYSLGGWVHVIIKYIASTNTFYLYLNGVYTASGSLSGALSAASGGRSFTIGAQNSSLYYAGLVEEFYFCNGTAYTDDDVAKTFAAKITHNGNLNAYQQDWNITGTVGSINRNIASDVIVNEDLNSLYFDLSSLPSTAVASFTMNARGSVSTAVAAQARMYTGTAATLDTAIGGAGNGLNFGFPSMITSCSLFVASSTANQYEPVNDVAAYFLFETIAPFRLMYGGTTLTAGLGSGSLGVVLVVSTGAQSVAITPSANVWNTVLATSALLATSGMEIFTDTTGGAFTVTLPAGPSIGNRVRIYDQKGTWSSANVTVARNGANIGNSASNLILNVTNGWVELVYDGVTNNNWKVITA